MERLSLERRYSKDLLALGLREYGIDSPKAMPMIIDPLMLNLAK
jgi:hypothetical protein